MLLTFGLGDDMADPQSLAHIMKGLVPRIAPLINIIIWAGPQHVVHSIITGTCKQHSSLRGCATTSVHIFPHGIAKEQRARISPSADSHSSTPKELCNNTLNWNWEKKKLKFNLQFCSVPMWEGTSHKIHGLQQQVLMNYFQKGFGWFPWKIQDTRNG